MEDQLAAYRAKKAREKSTLERSWLSSVMTFLSGTLGSIKQDNTQTEISSKSTPTTPTEPVTISDDGEISTTKKSWFSTVTALKTMLWFLLWGLFIELEFGAVFFALSLLIIIYFNTRTGPKRGNNLSAYSVFNPNCERLEGTFTAEQFEKELRFGAGSVH